MLVSKDTKMHLCCSKKALKSYVKQTFYKVETTKKQDDDMKRSMGHKMKSAFVTM